MLMQPSLSESDIRMFMQPAPRRKRGGFTRWTQYLGAFLATLIISFIALNLPAWLSVNNTPTFSPTVQAAPVVASALPQTTPAPTPPPALTIPDNSVSVPDLGISAPIAWDSSLDATTVHAELEHGVIHVGGTAHPGQHGISVITGHSSNYFWDKGQFNTIFAPLHKARTGMQIAVAYQGRQYIYTVSKISVVKPTDLSVLSDNQTVGIRLVTCTPIGTSLNRLVVEAVQTSPDQSSTTPFTPAQFTNELPATK